MKYDVFISYSSHDQKVVEGLCAYLEQHKIRCFVAYRDIPRGVVWARAIVEALDESRMMVVVFSDHFNNSDQVDREIELASEDRKPILTFRITDDVFKGAKKYYLKNINWIDAFPNPDAVFGTVVENVAKLIDIKLEAPASTPKPARTASSPKTYKVGDYYNENGKEGVVFEVSADGCHGKIVGLDQTTLMWCTDEQAREKIIVGANSRVNGKINTDKVMAKNNASEYPAFVWCRNKGKDWYLPAIEELYVLLTNDAVHNSVNKTLKQKGACLLSNKGGYLELYWSSTEKENWEGMAYIIDMEDASIASSSKNQDFLVHVRAVATF